MSTGRAVASVTAVLQNMLIEAMAEDHVKIFFENRDIKVSALAPDRVKIEDNAPKPQLNLFLYSIQPNAGLRNEGLPSRDGGGERLTNPPLALDLHYLLSAYGQKDLEAETLLGFAMQTLHETPVLTRDKIREVEQDPETRVNHEASDTRLADQTELVKLSPITLGSEETSKLWSAFQTNYRPSAAYHASVVLIQAEEPARAPLPVVTRGRFDPATGSERGVVAQANLLPPFPTLEEASGPNTGPVVRLGDVLKLRGHHLDGNRVARFTHQRSSTRLELPASPGATAAGLDIQMPPAAAPQGVAEGSDGHPDSWRAGVYSVAAVVHDEVQDHPSNELAVALAPSMSKAEFTEAGGVVTVEVTCAPKVWKGQQVTLVVGNREVVAEPLTADKTDTLTFESSSFPSGSQWLRLRVDGVESVLVDRTVTPPKFHQTALKIGIPDNP